MLCFLWVMFPIFALLVRMNHMSRCPDYFSMTVDPLGCVSCLFSWCFRWTLEERHQEAQRQRYALLLLFQYVRFFSGHVQWLTVFMCTVYGFWNILQAGGGNGKAGGGVKGGVMGNVANQGAMNGVIMNGQRSEEHTSELQSR